MDEPDDPKTSDDNAPTSRTEVGVLGGSIADNYLLDQSIDVTRNTAPSATDTIVRQATNL